MLAFFASLGLCANLSSLKQGGKSTMVGAFFIDIVNAVVIRLFLSLPMY